MNYQVKDSYKITSIAEIKMQVIVLYDNGKLNKSRSVMSYVKEWHAHNVLYKLGIAKERTKDVDLNDNESIFRRFCYTIIWLFTSKKKGI